VALGRWLSPAAVGEEAVIGLFRERLFELRSVARGERHGWMKCFFFYFPQLKHTSSSSEMVGKTNDYKTLDPDMCGHV
jgi:hypothetical protein